MPKPLQSTPLGLSYNNRDLLQVDDKADFLPLTHSFFFFRVLFLKFSQIKVGKSFKIFMVYGLPQRRKSQYLPLGFHQDRFYMSQ